MRNNCEIIVPRIFLHTKKAELPNVLASNELEQEKELLHDLQFRMEVF